MADPSTASLIDLGGGSFRMGTADPRFPGDGEGPVRTVSLSRFSIAAELVTNDRFATFVQATGHLTAAERDGSSFVFAGLLSDRFEPTRGVAGAEWWRVVDGVDWRHPEGPHSDLSGRGDHPVVHVDWFDASAFAAYEQLRLPTEAEWEFAARGGLDQAVYPWGDELTPRGEHRCNIWQGVFPSCNTLDDGWFGTSPVTAYPPNRLGVRDAAGNVWEWCADWFDPIFHVDGPGADPSGPSDGERRTMRGGSYLCHESYCDRYRVGARTSNTPDTTTGRPRRPGRPLIFR